MRGIIGACRSTTIKNSKKTSGGYCPGCRACPRVLVGCAVPRQSVAVCHPVHRAAAERMNRAQGQVGGVRCHKRRY